MTDEAEKKTETLSIALELGDSPTGIMLRLARVTHALGDEGLPGLCDEHMDKLAKKAEALKVEPFDLMVLFLASVAARIDSQNQFMHPGECPSMMATAFVAYQELLPLLMPESVAGTSTVQ